MKITMNTLPVPSDVDDLAHAFARTGQRVRGWLLPAALALLAGTSVTCAQPPSSPVQPSVTATALEASEPPAPPEGARPPRLLDAPGPLRAVLERIKERLERGLKAVDGGIAALDRGEDAASVRKGLEPAWRDLRQGWSALLPPERGPGEGRGPGGFGGDDPLGGPEGPGGPGGPGRREGRPDRDRPRGPGAGAPDGPGGLGGPGGPGGAGGPEGPGPRGPLSDQERERLREIIREHRPALMDRIESLARDDQAGADRLLGGLSGRLRALDEERQHDPAMFELHARELENLVDIMTAAGQITRQRRQGAGEDVIKPLQDQLRTLMGVQFDIRLEIQQKQVADLRERATRRESEISRLRERRDAMIDQRLQEVLRNAETFMKRPGPPPPAKAPASAPGER